MIRRAIVFAAIAAAAGIAIITDTARTSAAQSVDQASRVLAISGSPSSGRYCVSAAGSNIHGLGWVDVGTTYSVTFDSDVTLVSAITRIDLSAGAAFNAYGTPDLNFRASTAGTMALLVSGNGKAGCYRFNVQIEPSSITQTVRGSSTPFVALPKATKSSIHPMAITGDATSAKQCIAGDGVANAHGLGHVGAGTRVTIAFDSDFDAIAAVTSTNIAGQHGSYVIDDDGRGNNDPALSFTTSEAGTLVLFVGGYNGAAGCYHYKAEIGTTETPLPPQGSGEEFDFTGSFPDAAPVTYVDSSGRTVQSDAYPGQIQAFFETSTSQTVAETLIENAGGRLLARFPSAGYYLVAVTVGTESAFISKLEADSRVIVVQPHVWGYLAAGTLLDDCDDAHAVTMKDIFIRSGGIYEGCEDISDPNEPGRVSSHKITFAINEAVKSLKSGPILLNLSASRGVHNTDFDGISAQAQQQAKDGWIEFIVNVLTTISNLPEADRARTVIAIAAGNGHMRIDSLLDEIRAGRPPRLARVLEENVVIATTNQYTLANYTAADGHRDVAVINDVQKIPELRNGTSAASPPALAVVDNVIRKTGANGIIAVRALKAAQAKRGELIERDAVEEAQKLVNASGFAFVPPAQLSATKGKSFSFSFAALATGGHPPYHFQLDTLGGFPPIGLTLAPNGVLSGTPTTTGSATFRVCAVDLDGASACNPVTVVVTEDPCTTPTVSPTSFSATAAGGNGRVNVDIADDCSWTAASGSAFITVTSVVSGKGPGYVIFNIAANTGAERTGLLTVAGRGVAVRQAGQSTNSFDGSYRATRSAYSCTPAATCGDNFPPSGCSNASFTFTVSKNIIKDACENFDPGTTIPSNGSFSTKLYGFIPVTGTWTTGTFTLKGSTSNSSGTYNVTLTITKTQ